jgi:hypothetical protein
MREPPGALLRQTGGFEGFVDARRDVPLVSQGLLASPEQLAPAREARETARKGRGGGMDTPLPMRAVLIGGSPTRGQRNANEPAR